MLEVLDIRTLSFTNLIFCFIYGFGLITYAVNHRKFDGISMIGYGFIGLGLGFLLISLRQFANEFISIIIANMLILIGVVLIYQGLITFRQAKVSWGKYLIAVLFLIMMPSFVYYTYIEPNINARIIIFALCLSLLTSLCSYALLYKSKQNGGVANTFLGIMFLIIALFYIFRAVWTLGENELNSFMDAGIVHAFSIITFQLMVLFTSFSVIWISSNILEQELKNQARIDPLTLVYNRRALEEMANYEMIRTIRSRRPFSVIMSDIDHFKLFNDTHGHQLGDKVLTEFARVLIHNVRANDFVARYGGEEFIIILPETTKQQASIVAEKLRAAVEQHKILTTKKESLTVTASFGVSHFHEGTTDWKQIVKAADHALYDAKNRGRNCVVVESIGNNWASVKIK